MRHGTLKCPHCHEFLDLPIYAWHNVESYRKSATVVSVCCNKPIRLHSVQSFRADTYNGIEKTDDWGTPIPVQES